MAAESTWQRRLPMILTFAAIAAGSFLVTDLIIWWLSRGTLKPIEGG